MIQQKTYGGAWPVMVTPFTQDGQIDWPAYESAIEWYIERRVGGLFAVCATSEMFHLTADERLRLAREAVRAAGGRVPVVATGAFGDDTAAHVESVRRTADTGVDAVVLLLPPFAQGDDGLERYYDAILAQTDCTLGVYECPVPAPRSLPPALTARLALTGRFACYKETSCDVATLAAQCAATAGTALAVLQANTPFLIEARRLGCPGSMCISATIVPELVRDVLALPDDLAQEPYRRLCALEAIRRVSHPAAAKFLLAERGLPIGPTSRKPGKELSAEVRVMLREAWRFVRDSAPGELDLPTGWDGTGVTSTPASAAAFPPPPGPPAALVND
jgi:4-hydroxy-tetrahydrodipicolinate synthase